MKIWTIIVAISLFSFLIFRARIAIRMSNKIKRQLKIKDDHLFNTKLAKIKAKESNNLEAIQNINDFNKFTRNSFFIWILLIVLVLVGTLIIGISSVR